MKKLLFILTCMACLLALRPASAQEVQIGTVNDNYQYKSNNVPFYDMSKNGEGMVMYKQAILSNIPAGSLIKSMAFKGTQSSAGRIYETIDIYVANVPASTTSLDSFIIQNPDGEGTVADTGSMTHFATLQEYEFQQSTTVADVLTATSEKGFTYDGGNIVIYMKATNCHGSSSGGSYTNFFQAGVTNIDYRSAGKYRDLSTNPTGYTRSWSSTGTSGSGINVPVVTFGLAAAAEELTYKQVGTTETPMTYKNRTSNMPFYTMAKYGQGLNLYKKSILGLDANSLIKELSFYIFNNKKNIKYSKIELYLANTAENSVDSFIIAGENEGNSATTVVDLSKMTLFASYEDYELPPTGTAEEYAEGFKFESNEGFNYSGDNLVVYINAAAPGGYSSNYFATASNSGIDWRNSGKYRNSSYTAEQYGGGYGINCKSWDNVGTGNGSNVPVMKIGIGGGVQIVIPATVKGAVTNARNNASVAGATVRLNDLTAVTGADGRYEINVENVDMSVTYTLSVEAEGYESTSKTIDIKAGGEFTENIALTKLPVPATLSGKVISAADATTAIAGAELSYNGISATSADDGSYTFSIPNIDELPNDGAPLTAVAEGYIDYANNLKVTGDMTFNIEMTPQGEIPGEGVLIGKFNYKNYSYQLPIYSLWRYSRNEMIYPASALTGLQQGDKIGSVSFYGYSPVSKPGGDTGDEGDEEDDDYWSAPRKAAGDKWSSIIKVYMIDCDADSFTSDDVATDLSGLTPLYEGTVEVTEGEGTASNPIELFNLTFDKAYTYGGGNVKIIVCAESPQTKLVYFATDKSFTSNGLQDAESNPITTPRMQLVKTGLPVMRLGSYVPTGTVKGKVLNAVTLDPLADSEVILGEGAGRVTVITDDEGNYSAVMRNIEFDKAYRIVASNGDYNDYSGQVKFTETNPEVTLDINLDYNVTLTGVVTVKIDDNAPEAAADATVSYGAFTTTTDETGAYTLEIENVTEPSITITAVADNRQTTEQVEVPAPGEYEKDIVIAYSGVITIDAVKEGKVKVFTIDGLGVNADKLEHGRPYIMIDSEGNAVKALLK